MNRESAPIIINILKPYEVVRRKLYKKLMIKNIVNPILLVLTLYLLWKNIIFVVLIPILTPILGSHAYEATIEKKNFIQNLKNGCLEKLLKNYNNIKYFTLKCGEYSFDSSILKKEIYKSQYLNCAPIKEFCCYIDDYYEINSNNKKIKLWDYKIAPSGFRGMSLLFDLNKEIKDNIIISSKGISQKNKRAFKYTSIILIEFTFFYFCLKHFIDYTLTQRYFFESDYTIIITIGFLFLMICATIYWAIKYNPRKDHKKDFLEDIEFNKNYNIETNNEIEARYILTPIFIEALNKLKNLYKSNKLYCHINKNKLFIMISSKKNSFEIGKINKTLFDKQTIDNFYNEIKTLLETTESLSRF